MTIGPVQMLVVGFEGDKFTGEIAKELARLKEGDIIRVIDLLFVKKDANGELEILQHSDLNLDEAHEFGAVVGALVGFGAGGEEEATTAAIAGANEMDDGHFFDESEVWYLADAIPEGMATAVALIEHRWAIPLRDAIARAGGHALADEWIHAKDLVAIGLAANEAAVAG
jgi:uncharacterized membrane protein